MRSRADPVVHLELHTRDLEAAAHFYARVCGWAAERVVTEHGAYRSLELGAGLGGGVVECATTHPLWVPYVEVEEIEAATARATEHGARLLLAPREGPAGWRSVVDSPAGGGVALWQPKR